MATTTTRQRRLKHGWRLAAGLMVLASCEATSELGLAVPPPISSQSAEPNAPVTAAPVAAAPGASAGKLAAFSPQAAPGSCLAAMSGDAADTLDVSLSPCANSNAQLWLYGDGAMRQGSSCLTVLGGIANPGTHVQLAPCELGNDAQTWAYDGNALMQQHNLCLAQAGDANAPTVRLWPCAAGDTAQTWGPPVAQADSMPTSSSGAPSANPTASANAIPAKPSADLIGIPASAKNSRTQVRSDSNFFNASFMTQDPVVAMHTTMWVPSEPPASGTLFVWPGLQNSGNVLQPVLVWGPVCTTAKTQPPANYSTWWIAGFYVNDACQVGQAMAVAVGDALDIDFASKGQVWTLTMKNLTHPAQVTFEQDVGPNPENWAIFSVEHVNQFPNEPVYFANTTITFATPQAETCKLFDIGINDGITDVMLSEDKLSCKFSGLVLRNSTPGAQSKAVTRSVKYLRR